MDAKTVVVVGAGAGVSFGFPTGSALSDRIAAALDFRRGENGKPTGDQELFNRFRRLPPEEARTNITGCREIVRGIHYFQSVDEFLHSRRDQPEIVWSGKMAIAWIINDYESKSKMLTGLDSSERNVRDNALKSLRKTWISKLFTILTPGVSRSDLPQNLFSETAFVNFNYDRCVEHCLFHLVQEAFGVNGDMAARTLDQLKILHPYGKIGSLPWQDSEELCVPFGEITQDLGALASQISTYTEQAQDSGRHDEIKRLVSGADRVLFLGFGFHEQNMRVLQPYDSQSRYRNAFATAVGVSPSSRGVFSQRVRGAINVYPQNGVTFGDADTDCEKMISDYGPAVWL